MQVSGSFSVLLTNSRISETMEQFISSFMPSMAGIRSPYISIIPASDAVYRARRSVSGVCMISKSFLK